ncbi:MAG: hypothetical protein XXXNARYT_003638 [Candidatus Accumulibacter regalis]
MPRITFWSAQPEVIFLARTSPMPGISRRRSGDCSMTSNTAAPKAFTSLPAVMPERKAT